MDVLEIRYENGHMTINVPVYFPCLQKHARKLFPLIKRYCTGDDRAVLGRYLFLLRAFLQAQMETGDGFSGVPPDWEYGSRFVTYSVTERKFALFMGGVLLGKCDEVWVFRNRISAGMREEIDKAERMKKKIRRFSEELEEEQINGIG